MMGLKKTEKANRNGAKEQQEDRNREEEEDDGSEYMSDNEAQEQKQKDEEEEDEEEEEEEDESEYMSVTEGEEQQEDGTKTNITNCEEEYESEYESEEEHQEDGEEDESEYEELGGGEKSSPISSRVVSVQKPNTTRSDEGLDSECDWQKTQQYSPKPNKRPTEEETEQNGRRKKKKVSNEGEAMEKKKSAIIIRFWSEDDEIAILKGMVEYKWSKGADPYSDMGAFHEFINKCLHVNASRKQLTDKLHRLKKKYKNNAAKGKNRVFSKAHEQKSFELSKKIWGTGAATATATGIIKASPEDFLSMYPRLNESLQSGNGLSMAGRNFLKENMSLIGSANAEKLEEKWRNLHVEKIRLYLMRVELIRKQTKLVLNQMRKSYKFG